MNYVFYEMMAARSLPCGQIWACMALLIQMTGLLQGPELLPFHGVPPRLRMPAAVRHTPHKSKQNPCLEGTKVSINAVTCLAVLTSVAPHFRRCFDHVCLIPVALGGLWC